MHIGEPAPLRVARPRARRRAPRPAPPEAPPPLAPQRLDERPVLGEEVVALERRRLVAGRPRREPWRDCDRRRARWEPSIQVGRARSPARGDAASRSRAWLQASGSAQAVRPSRVTCSEQPQLGLARERVLDAPAGAVLVAHLPVVEAEPERRDQPRVAAGVVVALEAEDAAVGEEELALGGGDRRAHPRRGRIDGAEGPRKAEQRAVDAHVDRIDAADGAVRVAEPLLEDRRHGLAAGVAAADPQRADVAAVLLAPEGAPRSRRARTPPRRGIARLADSWRAAMPAAAARPPWTVAAE